MVIVSVLNVAIAQSPIIRECVEKLAEVADAMWNFPFKLKSKQQLIAETSKTFTKAHQQRYVSSPSWSGLPLDVNS